MLRPNFISIKIFNYLFYVLELNVEISRNVLSKNLGFPPHESAKVIKSDS